MTLAGTIAFLGAAAFLLAVWTDEVTSTQTRVGRLALALVFLLMFAGVLSQVRASRDDLTGLRFALGTATVVAVVGGVRGGRPADAVFLALLGAATILHPSRAKMSRVERGRLGPALFLGGGALFMFGVGIFELLTATTPPTGSAREAGYAGGTLLLSAAVWAGINAASPRRWSVVATGAAAAIFATGCLVAGVGLSALAAVVLLAWGAAAAGLCLRPSFFAVTSPAHRSFQSPRNS